MSVNEFMQILEKIYQCDDFLKKILVEIHESEKEMIQKSEKLNNEMFSTKISLLNKRCTDWINQINSRQIKTGNIREILENKEIQIIFVGAVSCGKSKIINSILQEEIFPSSIGSTTTRIVKLTGTDDALSSIKYADKFSKYDNKENLYDEVMNVSSNVEDDDLQQDDLVVHLSSPVCSLLNSKIFLIDTPGYDSSDCSKSVVMETCQTSDIIVFVMTYVFSEEEKEIFKILSEKTSELNLYILINKWDESDNDENETVEMSKNVMEKRLIEWFQGNSKMTENLAKERIFFISALEQMNLILEPDENINEFRKNEFNRFIKALKTSLDYPEFCKCLKHEKDINKMKYEMESNFINWNKDVDEFLKSRSHFISQLKAIYNFIEAEEKCIKEKLLIEKEIKLKNIEVYMKSLKGWFNYLTNNENTKDNELLDLKWVVEKFDKHLNDLEKVVDENLSASIDDLDKNLENKKFILNLSKHSSILKLTDKSVDKKQKKSKSKSESQIILENQMIDIFDDFNKTINIRIKSILEKIKLFINILIPNETHLKQKLKEIVEYFSINSISHSI